MTNIFPNSKRVYPILYGPSEEEISRCKINFREDRLKAILEGTKFEHNPDRHEPKSDLIEVKPLSAPTGNFFYIDYNGKSGE